MNHSGKGLVNLFGIRWNENRGHPLANNLGG